MTLRDEGPILGPPGMHFLTAIILFAGIGFGIALVRDGSPYAGLAFAVGLLPASITAFQLVRLFRALGRATLEIPSDVGRVPMGWRGTATYVRPLRGGASLRAVEGALRCEERVTRQNGKHKKIWLAVVADEPLAPMPYAAPPELRVQIPIAIPAGGPATFEYIDNEVFWWVRLRLTMDGCPNTQSSFRIRVAPAVKR